MSINDTEGGFVPSESTNVGQCFQHGMLQAACSIAS
jgi:hypothetical protein